MNRLLLALFIALLGALPPQSAQAEAGTGPWAGEQEVQARLISPVSSIGGQAQVPLGLEVRMPPGWHTYWRSPGLAGLAPVINWDESRNLADTLWQWPAPTRLVSQGLESFGYLDQVVFPILVTPRDPALPLSLRGKLDLLACKELCIPFTLDLTLDLPTGTPGPTVHQATLRQAQTLVPKEGHDGFDIRHVNIDAQTITVDVSADPPLQDPELFVESKSGYLFPAAQLEKPDRLVTRLSEPARAEKPLTQDTFILTLIDGDRRIEKTFTPDPATSGPASPAAVSPTGILAALLAAFVGGLILNLMPCVLPVLSLKLLAIIRHAGAPHSHIRASFLASAAGILTSFAALAALAITLKQAGVAIGWGVQFQHPAFIIPMLAVLTLFTASMWNLIEIPLPRFLADAINDRLPLPGEHDRTLTGNFLTGAFATLLATPCSAPFVGTALGFALAGSALELALVALAMGLGLAAPYLLVAACPSIAHYLPRPGRWMDWIRGLFGAALFFTALWLASVLAPQLGQRNASLAGGLVLLALAILWIRAAIARPLLILKGLGVIALLLALAFNWHRLPGLNPADDAPVLHWQTFDESAIPGLVAAGKIVFVDVTADWCLTCHANKRFVLEADPTRTRLSTDRIVLMKADWTTPSDAITAYLKKFGRYGIPFNVVYGPDAPEGITLPELLTAARVENALQQAGATVPPAAP